MAWADPIARLEDALGRAGAASPFDPTAAALATADATGRPSVRMVLVKRVDARGLAFFTSLESRKARDLEENARAALCFHWPAIEEQVRAEGTVSPVPDAEADGYFAMRPRESQIGAWASRQSEPLGSRDELEAAASRAEARFAGGTVPRPRWWGGYLLVPERIEFWRSAEGRLHHRTLYARAAGGWTSSLLQP
jgi:pyridoxamine 5'-phosphate oxidase